MTLRSPEVSFVVIGYNELDRAPRAVGSILGQDTPCPFEVVYVDDGSTDGTAEALEYRYGTDPRLRIVRLPTNKGRGAARAAGVELATAPAIALVDSDITLPPDWLERCLAAFPGHAAVGGIPVPDGDAAVVARIAGASPKVVPGQVPITGSNVLFDATILRSEGFDPRDRLGEDFRLAHRLIRGGRRLFRVPGLVVEHAEGRSYLGAIRWRWANALDASTHPRELDRIRLADVVWAGWLVACAVSIGGALGLGSGWLLLGAVATAVPGLLHAVTRFHPRPLGAFLLACLLDIPLLAVYLLGRTAGIPRLIRGRG